MKGTDYEQVSYDQLTKKQKKQVCDTSGYDDGQMEFENPLFIPAVDFKEYAQEFAEEIGAIPENNDWPMYCIDWEHAARELSMDYSSATIDGIDYLFRAW